mgnify:CR=1 FL=1
MADMSIRKLFTEIPAEGMKECTVSGWVLEQVGRVPEPGDHFVAEGLDVTVTKVEHRRVLEIQVIALPDEDED